MKETPYLTDKHDMLGQLRTLPALEAFEDSNLLKMLNLSKLRKYDAGETIMQEGALDCWMYFLLKGSVRVIKGGKPLSVLSRYGEMFGEMSVVDGAERSATVVAETPVMCLALDGSIVDRVGEADKPAFFAVLYRFIAEVLSERLRLMDQELSEVKAELERLKHGG
ncbi:MAG: cyclic nucleotide-binding domain-containing protein [Desulfovibrionaceae bacterium]|jgi:CRP-like cAMP-binding protein|nr:cyclic nucleotide-binding domain-containing protein [Desulfovibrionaceae bacterium]